MDEEKVRIKLNIAGEMFMLTVPYSRQEETRQVEAEVNTLFDTWRKRFPDKKDRELLAMTAFRFADRYYAMLRREEETRRLMAEMGREAEALAGEDA